MLQEGREVRAGAEIANVGFFAFNGRRIGLAPFSIRASLKVPLFEDGAAERAWDRARDFANELLERRHGGSRKVWTGDGDIDVEVCDGMIEKLALLLHPFGGADEAFLFRIPTAEDDGALWPPALVDAARRCHARLLAWRRCRCWDRLHRRPKRRDDCPR